MHYSMVIRFSIIEASYQNWTTSLVRQSPVTLLPHCVNCEVGIMVKLLGCESLVGCRWCTIGGQEVLGGSGFLFQSERGGAPYFLGWKSICGRRENWQRWMCAAGLLPTPASTRWAPGFFLSNSVGFGSEHRVMHVVRLEYGSWSANDRRYS
jgi:hypothetical protein